ncbi:MAG: hypothetical protein SAK42_13630 [Oscillatoria sp. PMC 1076.18]|nr:hypothetical protein [Oscillatoria sp. PMC 1076.18]
MGNIVTLELPEPVAQRAKEIAAFTQKRLEDVLVDWLNYAIAELPLESLPDEQIIALCELEMPTEQQQTMSELLTCQREGQLSSKEKQQLNELMQIYRQGLVRKARAIKVAVERGLKPALN